MCSVTLQQEMTKSHWSIIGRVVIFARFKITHVKMKQNLIPSGTLLPNVALKLTAMLEKWSKKDLCDPCYHTRTVKTLQVKILPLLSKTKIQPLKNGFSCSKIVHNPRIFCAHCMVVERAISNFILLKPDGIFWIPGHWPSRGQTLLLGLLYGRHLCHMATWWT